LLVTEVAALRQRIAELEKRLETCEGEHPGIEGGRRGRTHTLRDGSVQVCADEAPRALNTDLERRLAEMQALFEVIPIGICLAEDPDCQHIRSNPALERLLGLVPGSNASCTPPSDVPPPSFRLFRGERELGGHELPMQRAATENRRIENQDFEVLRADGSRAYVVGNAAPLHDAEGNVRGVVGAFVDITVRRQTEEVLRAYEQRLKLAQRAARAGAWEIDLVSGLHWWSEEEYLLHGLDPAYFQPSLTHWLDALFPEDREAVADRLGAAITLGRDVEVEYRIAHAELGVRWLLRVGHVYRNGEGRPLRLLGFTFDITERKLTEQALKAQAATIDQLLAAERTARREAEQANRAKDEFLAMLSHELRTPLNPIFGWTQMLRRGRIPPELQEQALESIERNARLQNRLIEDLLDTSRIVEGKFHCRMQRIAPSAVVASALEAVRESAGTADVAVEVDCPATLPTLSADPARLVQVVTNLLTNAIKFTPPGGTVRLALTTDGDRLHLVVTDTGVGIPGEFLPQLFSRFHQAESGTTRRQGGLGLGLFIVRSIVEAHGGTVWAESAGAGQGAAFHIALPLDGE
jgi:signal transduction histidine kinase